MRIIDYEVECADFPWILRSASWSEDSHLKEIPSLRSIRLNLSLCGSLVVRPFPADATMARLNIETSLWQDPRFLRLIIAVGDRHRAVGMIVELWSVAQRYWCPDQMLIPTEVWSTLDLEPLVACGLAEPRGDGIYAKGIEKHFEWWFKASNAGKNGAAVTNKKRWGNRHSVEVDDKPRRVDDVPRGVDQGTVEVDRGLSPSSSSSSSTSPSKKRRLVADGSTTALWKFYEEALRQKGIVAIHEGKKTGQLCKKVVTEHGLELAKKLVAAYLDDSEPFIKDNAWQFPIFVTKRQKYLARVSAAHTKKPLTWGEE